jgi:hypothetical protein
MVGQNPGQILKYSISSFQSSSGGGLRVFDDFGVFKYSVFKYWYLDALLIKNQTRNDNEYLDTPEYMHKYSKSKQALNLGFMALHHIQVYIYPSTW